MKLLSFNAWQLCIWWCYKYLAKRHPLPLRFIYIVSNKRSPQFTFNHRLSFHSCEILFVFERYFLVQISYF